VRKHVIPRAVRFGKDLAHEVSSEIGDVFTKRKSPRLALKDSVKRAAKRQIGGSKAAKRKPKSRITKRGNIGKRSRSDFFTNVKYVGK
jgi:hypothetical protein